jgi:hypothetical protein
MVSLNTAADCRSKAGEKKTMEVTQLQINNITGISP